METNKRIRVFGNWLENVGNVQTILLIGGLYMPVTYAIWGGLYVLARILYVILYLKAPSLRVYSVPVVLGTQVFLPMVTIGAMIALFLNKPI